MDHSGLLEVTDTRTERSYVIPIKNNAINAVDFMTISASGDGGGDGLKVFDPGYRNTAVKESSITFVDGNKGIIKFRGYPIETLYAQNDFEDVAFLLIWGHLPTSSEKKTFQRDLAQAASPPTVVLHVIRAFPRNASTSSMVLAGLSAWTGAEVSNPPIHLKQNENSYHGNMKRVDKEIVRVMSAMAAVMALTFCHKNNLDFTPADPERSYVENCVTMMSRFEESSRDPDRKVVEHLQKLWILFADHEMTNSTAAFLHAASALGDPMACSIAALSSGLGQLHGGAIDMAYKSFERIGSVNKVPNLIAQVRQKKQRLAGYGHRIYKTEDPRTKFIRAMMDELSCEMKNDSLLSIALEIDRIASTDEYFTSRNLKVNADLYGCFVYTSLGFEPDMVMLLAATARTAGWMAHWRESMSKKTTYLLLQSYLSLTNRFFALSRPTDVSVASTADLH
ncbi:MAG: hypothetical protein MMC33_002222 [Icmadophila ericetorum]|nr:hypothetical protein [Icmadophila ericetorum]